MVTSRALLQVYGEREFLVPPLALPDLRRLPPLELLLKVTAVALFAERARAVQADFALTTENAPAVAEICTRLDGLPLAIELAAAGCKLFSPQAMLARLTGTSGQSSLQMLTTGARDLPARQQTLRGAMDWSYNLLDVGEKKTVCATGGEARLLCQCHAGYFLSMAERAAPEPRAGPQQVMWLDRLEREYDNLRAALWRFWYWHSHLSEGCRWMTAALSAARYLPQLALVRVRALKGAGSLASALGDYVQAASLLEEGLALCRELGQPGRAMTARILNTLGTVTFNRSNYRRARTLYEESLALQRELGDEVGIAHALNNLGTVVSYQGDYEQAETFAREPGPVPGAGHQVGHCVCTGQLDARRFAGETACGPMR